MLKFKSFINEGTELLLERAESINWLVFNERSHIPLSKRMLERIEGGKAEKKYGIHITNDDGLYTLIDIQNSAKQISVMTDARGSLKELLKGGVATTGGVWTIIYGYPVIE